MDGDHLQAPGAEGLDLAAVDGAVVDGAAVDDDHDRELEEVIRKIMGWERLMHHPSRLAILHGLQRAGWLRFAVLKEMTGMSKGNLSNHLAKLEGSGMVERGKHFEEGKAVTVVSLTEEGAGRFERFRREVSDVARLLFENWADEKAGPPSKARKDGPAEGGGQIA